MDTQRILKQLWIVPVAILVVLNIFFSGLAWLFRMISEGCGMLADICECERNNDINIKDLKKMADEEEARVKRMMAR